MRAFKVGTTRIVMCRVGDAYAALRDICPHHGAELSGGILGGTIVPCEVGRYQYGRDGEIVRCPRHGYEFDVWTGRSLHDPERMRVKVYEVVETDDGVYLELEDARG
jgi:nitrite reductase/ring-hydroxylating ferredoxin subunit